jgi:hypothetical protein
MSCQPGFGGCRRRGCRDGRGGAEALCAPTPLSLQRRNCREGGASCVFLHSLLGFGPGFGHLIRSGASLTRLGTTKRGCASLCDPHFPKCTVYDGNTGIVRFHVGSSGIPAALQGGGGLGRGTGARRELQVGSVVISNSSAAGAGRRPRSLGRFWLFAKSHRQQHPQ